MSLTRMLITTLVTTLFITAPSFGQTANQDKDAVGVQSENKSSQVEVETDRFSGKTTVRLLPQVLIDTPEHKLMMVMQNVDEFSGIRFKSASKAYISYGDRELWFIVDGKRMRIDTASESKAPSNLQDEDEKGRTPWTTLITSMSLPQLEEIVSGNKVEMRLGTVEVTWSQEVLANMREYVRTLASYAPSRQKTTGRRQR